MRGPPRASPGPAQGWREAAEAGQGWEPGAVLPSPQCPVLCGVHLPGPGPEASCSPQADVQASCSNSGLQYTVTQASLHRGLVDEGWGRDVCVSVALPLTSPQISGHLSR